MSDFEPGEVVRVQRLGDGWDKDDEWVIGEEGVVEGGYPPDEVMVWIRVRDRPGRRSLWIFDADLLVSEGMVDRARLDRMSED